MVIRELFLLISLTLFSISYTQNSTNENLKDLNKQIVDLDDNNFNQTINQNDFVVVYFYIPNNEKCVGFSSVYDEAHKTLVVDEGSNVVFSRIDGSKNMELVEKYEVVKYPTILFFRKLGNDFIRLKGKNKDLENLLIFIREEINPNYKWKEVKSLPEWEKKSDYKYVLLFFGNKEKYRNELIVTTRAIESIGNKIMLIITDSTELRNHFTILNENLELLLIVQPNFIKQTARKVIEINRINLNLIENFHTKNLANLISSYFRKPFALLTEKDSEKILSPAFNSLIIFFNKAQNSSNSEIIQNLMNFGDKNRASFVTFFANYGGKSTKDLLKLVPINQNELPCAFLISGVNKKTDIINKYKYNTSERGPLNEQNLNKFLADWKENKLQNILQSEAIPKEQINQYGVYSLVGDTFDNFVHKISYNANSVVLFTNKELINHKEIADRFYNISKHLSKANFFFGEIDPFKNEIELITIINHPGIAVFNNVHNKVEVKEFLHPVFKTNEILNFIKNETKVEVFSQYSEEEKLEFSKEKELVNLENEHDVGEMLKELSNDQHMNNDEFPSHMHDDL